MSTKKVQGITIAINADTSGVTSGLKELTTESIQLSKQLKSIDSLLELDPENVYLLAQRQELLARSVGNALKR